MGCCGVCSAGVSAAVLQVAGRHWHVRWVARASSSGSMLPRGRLVLRTVLGGCWALLLRQLPRLPRLQCLPRCAGLLCLQAALQGQQLGMPVGGWLGAGMQPQLDAHLNWQTIGGGQQSAHVGQAAKGQGGGQERRAGALGTCKWGAQPRPLGQQAEHIWSPAVLLPSSSSSLPVLCSAPSSCTTT